MNLFFESAGLDIFSHHCVSGFSMIIKIYWILFQILIQAGLGLMILFLVHSFTGGAWGQRLRPAFLRALEFMPQALLLFLPVALSLACLFRWATPAYQESLTQTHNAFRVFALTPFWFGLRSYLYLGTWAFFAWRLRRTAASSLARGLMLLVLLYTVSWAGMDWIMTIDPEWSSTGFGVMYVIACLNVGLGAGLTWILLGPQPQPPPNPVQEPQLLIDYGNLLLMSVLLWVYMNFMQYIVIWSAQQPQEIHWYHLRGTGIWPAVIVGIFVLHFLIPFPLLLMRACKTLPGLLAILASLFVFSQLLEDILWVLP